MNAQAHSRTHVSTANVQIMRTGRRAGAEIRRVTQTRACVKLHALPICFVVGWMRLSGEGPWSLGRDVNRTIRMVCTNVYCRVKFAVFLCAIDLLKRCTVDVHLLSIDTTEYTGSGQM